MAENNMTDSGQAPQKAKQFRLGPLGTLNQIIVALGKTIRAMADDSIESQKGARIANALGIARACLETQTLQQVEARLDELQALAAEGTFHLGHKQADDRAPVRTH
jgi:hypothetical protein